MMSKNNLYVAMACAILAFTGCTEDDMPGGNTKPAHPGEEIIFGGTLDSKNTRTVYGDKHLDDKYTEVKWVAGDGVRIYCAEALYQDADGKNIMQEGSTAEKPLYQKYCEYTVTDGVTNLGSVIDGEKQDTHSTGLKPSGEGYGLRWGSNGTHEFYAVYPSKTQLTGKDDEAANTLKLEENKLTAQLPNMQGATDANYSTYIKDDNGNVTYYPAMRYAYMTAYKSSVPVSNLSLTFEPIVTAVEITLQNKTKIEENGTEKDQDLEVEMITLSHPTAALCGTFTADLETKVVTNDNADASFKTVSVPTKMKSADGGTEKGNLLLAYGKTVTVTAFMALNNNTNLEQIKVSILANGQLKTATLSSTTNGVQIVQAKKKNFISTVNIGYTTKVAVDYSHWVRDLADVAPATPLGALSIPGAGGATSSTLTSNPASQEQTLTIDELWAQGVRCFEFTVDKGNTSADSEANAATFGAQNVYCNFLNTNVSLNDAVNAVVQNITPDEFGMIIITYQEQTAGNSRNASDNGFGGNFQRWWTSYTPTRTVVNEDGTTTTQTITKALYNSELTVSQAQGKIFCICRPNAIGADPGWYTGVADDNYDNNDTKVLGYTTKHNASIYCSKTNVSHPILCVLGWGNNPDQWYARGFGTLHTASSSEVNDANAGLEGAANRPFYVGTEGIPELEDYDYAGKSNFAYKVTNMADVPYTWNSTLAGGVFFDGWIQDWKRVVPNASTKVAYGISDTTTPLTGTKGSTKYYYNWSPSEDEKWEDIESTLDMAIKKEGGYSLYLNSLCGFFVDGSIGLSYQPCPTFQRYTEKKAIGTGDIVKFDDKYRGQFSISLDGNSYLGTSEVGDGAYGPFAVNGGYQGNIAAYADWVNTKFYNLLLQKQANGELTGKSAGIVMMDRVSDNAEANEAGYYIPRIIISMNFSGVESTTLEAKTSVLEEGEPVLGRKNFKVTWDN